MFTFPGILIPSVKGKKPTLLFRKYSYGLQKEPKGAKGIVRWYCSRRSRGNCKACLKANRETPALPIEISGTHNHEPPQFYIAKDGNYVRL